jgi:D-arabinose 1-dehydrogenase-like Zn-dependent alcohol dehydrogenase
LVVPAASLFSLPEADPQQLAMLGTNPPTASLLLDEASDLKPGDWVVQNAANSGVGRSLIAIAKARGIKTINLVRRPELIADEESAVTRHGYADGARPNRGVIHDEAGHEVLIFASRNPVLQAHADHFVTGPFRAVPRAMLDRKRIPAVFRGELVAIR